MRPTPSGTASEPLTCAWPSHRHAVRGRRTAGPRVVADRVRRTALQCTRSGSGARAPGRRASRARARPRNVGASAAASACARQLRGGRSRRSARVCGVAASGVPACRGDRVRRPRGAAPGATRRTQRPRRSPRRRRRDDRGRAPTAYGRAARCDVVTRRRRRARRRTEPSSSCCQCDVGAHARDPPAGRVVSARRRRTRTAAPVVTVRHGCRRTGGPGRTHG